jgi:hypothetical protein
LRVGGADTVRIRDTPGLAMSMSIFSAASRVASTPLEPVAIEDITTPVEHLTGIRAARAEGVGRVAVPT